MIENATAGLTLLAGDHEVVVTREEGHQELISRWAPGPDGLPRQVAVELVPAPVTHGPHRGRPGIEIHLDGARVGELTPLMAQRYGPLVDAHLRLGRRPAAVGRVHRDQRGFQVEVHLPRPDAVVVPEPTPAGHRRPRATPAATGVDLPGAGGPPGPEAPAGGRRRAPWLVGVGVVGLLVAVGAGVGGGRGTADTATGSTASAAVATAATSAASTPPSPTAAAPPAAPSVVVAGVPDRRTATPAPAGTPPRSTPAPARTSPAAPRPASTTAKPAPTPRPTAAPRPVPKPVPPAPAATPPSSCNPNYSGCVPNDPVDVDCAGGKGNGPSYVRGPVRVIGTDVYDLDGTDKDGIGCE